MLKNTLTITAAILLTTSLSAQQWEYKGLGGVSTNQLTINGDTVYASTSNGLYKKYLFSTDTLWQQVSLDGQNVINCLFLDQQECLLEVSVNTQQQATVLKSTDRGGTYGAFSDTGYVHYPYLNHLAKSPYGKDTLYLLNQYQKTFDGGQTWMPLGHMPQADNFIYVDPGNSGNLFVGGENMIFSPFLQGSQDHGQNWTVENTSTVFAGDNALHVMHILDGDWYASGEGIVVKRESDVSSWTQLVNVFNNPAWGMYMFGFAPSPVNNDVLYVSGEGQSPLCYSTLRMLKSADRGASWDTLTFTAPQISKYAVRDLKVVHIWGEDKVWLGGNGVFTYTQGVSTGIKEREKGGDHISIVPNPAFDHIVLKGLDVQDAYRVMITNVAGQILYRKDMVRSDHLNVPVQDWANGMYFVKISTYEKQQVLRFVKE